MSARRADGHDRVLRDLLAEARDRRPEQAWKETAMVAAFSVRWGLAIGLAVSSAVVAIAAVAFIASPAFTDSTGSFPRVALVGVVPALAILAVTCAAEASSRVLRVRWGAAMLGVLGAAASSVCFELWYAGVDGAPPSVALLLATACAAVALFGGALVLLLAPLLRSLPRAAAIAVALLAGAFGGAAALLLLFPMASAVLVAAAAVVVVALVRRADRRTAVPTPV